ncbi:MAG: VTT domain-containing protein [Bacteroidota bacterium]
MPKKKNIGKRLHQTHLYFWHNKLYWTVFKSVIQLIIIVGFLIGLYLFIDNYVFDIDITFARIINSIKYWQVFVLFFVSESFLGLIPPDLFIMWSSQLLHSWLALTLLAFIGYFGGIGSYSLGYLFGKNKYVRGFVVKRFSNNIKNLNRMGAIFIIIAALFPLPYSPVCLLAGMLKYSFKRFLFLGIFRIARFYIYAMLIYKLI